MPSDDKLSDHERLGESPVLYTPDAPEGVTVLNEEEPTFIPVEVRFPNATIVRGEGADPPRASRVMDSGFMPEIVAEKEETQNLHHAATLGAEDHPSYTAPVRLEFCTDKEGSTEVRVGVAPSSQPMPPASHEMQQAATVVGKVVVVLGPTGSGKTTSLKCHTPVDGPVTDTTQVAWDADKAVVSQFGGPDIAQRWLSACGLNSIPSWIKPYHVLSTGERFRADLARRLQAADAAKPSVSAVVLDDFGHSLDAITRGGCAVSAARAAREHRVCLVIASSLPDIASWVQPDVVIQLPQVRTCPPTLIRNSNAGTKPDVRVTVDVTHDKGLSQTNAVVVSPTKPLGCARMCAYGGNEVDFSCNPTNEPCTNGGTVAVSSIHRDEATEMCNKLFDVPPSTELTVRVPAFPTDSELGPFFVGLIVGPSGSGKSLIRRHIFGDDMAAELAWNADDTIRSHFNSKDEFSARMSILGFDPESLGERTINSISDGEFHVVSIARLLVHHDPSPQDEPRTVYLDEFTCALDRLTAARVARGVAEWARKHCAARYIFVTCHEDLDRALRPDWVYHTGMKTCFWRTADVSAGAALPLSPSPPMIPMHDLQVRLEGVGNGGVVCATVTRSELHLCLRQSTLSTWRIFRDHHYKTPTISTDSELFVLEAENQWPVGCVALIRHNGPRGSSGEFPRRAHRTVVLPSWQGLGIGSRLSDAVGETVRSFGCRYFGQTVHPFFGAFRDRSPLWQPTPWNHQVNHFKIETWRQKKEQVMIRLRAPRKIYSHEYVGSDDEGYFASRGISFVSRGVRSDPKVLSRPPSISTINIDGTRNPFEVFCRLTRATAVSTPAPLDRKTLVARWQRLPAAEKDVFIRFFRDQHAKGSPITKPAFDESGGCAIACNVTEGPRTLHSASSFCKAPQNVDIKAVIKTHAQGLEKGQILTTVTVCVRGYVRSRREAGSKLVFVDIIGPRSEFRDEDSDHDSGPSLQVLINRARFPSDADYELAKRSCYVNDIVQITGHPGKTRTGTGDNEGFSIIATALECLEPQHSAQRVISLASAWGAGVLATSAAAGLLGCDESLLTPLLELSASANSPTEEEKSLSQAVGQPSRPLTTSRLEKIQLAAKRRQRGLYVVLEQPNHPGNVAAVMRNSDAFGVTEIIVVGEALTAAKHQRFRSQSSSANKWVKVTSIQTVEACLEYLGPDVIHFGTAVHSELSKTLDAVNFNPPKSDGSETARSISLWFGNEVHGLTDNALDACSAHVFVPMSGVVESLNLSVSVGILLWEVTRQRLKHTSVDFVLSPAEQERLIAELTEISRGESTVGN